MLQEEIKPNYILLTGRKPFYMKVFGSKCYADVEQTQKLGHILKEGIFVRYDRCSPVYLVYFLATRKIGKFKRAKFVSKRTGMDMIG